MAECEPQFDAELFAKAQQGDTVALQELLLEFFDPLHRRIAGRVDEKLAQKVTAEGRANFRRQWRARLTELGRSPCRQNPC